MVLSGGMQMSNNFNSGECIGYIIIKCSQCKLKCLHERIIIEKIIYNKCSKCDHCNDERTNNKKLGE